MMTNKTFLKFTDSGFGRSRKCTFVSEEEYILMRTYVPSTKEGFQCSQSDHGGRSSWEWCHIEGWVLVSTAGRLGTQLCHSPVPCVAWKSMLLRPCITSSSDAFAILSMSSLNKDRGGWGKKQSEFHRNSHLALLITSLARTRVSLIEISI